MLILRYSKPTTMNVMINKARHNKFTSAGCKKRETERARKETLQQTKIQLPNCKLFLAWDISYARSNSDPDNQNGCIKPILDGMQAAKLLTNDDFKVIQPTMFFYYTKMPSKQQRVVCTIFMDSDSYIAHIVNNLKRLE